MRRSTSTLVLVALAASYGCPQRVSTLPSGPDAGGEGRSDGGLALDGGAAADAGAPADAGGDPRGGFAWAELALPENTQTPLSVWGGSADEVYIGTTVGFLYRVTPAGAARVWRTPTNFGLRHLWGAGDRLFAADDRTLYVFDRGDPSAPLASLAVGDEVGGLHGAAADRVYLASARTNERSLYLYDGAGVNRAVENLTTASLGAVWAEASPGGWTVRIAGNGRVILFDGLTVADEAVDWPAEWGISEIANFFVEDLTRADDVLLGVGTGGGVLVRAAGGPWRFERRSEDGAGFRAVAPLPGVRGGAVAVGESVGGHPIWFRDATGWAPDPYTESVTLFDVWAPDADTVYAVGFRRGGSGAGVALVGRRR